jgi:cyclopropane-fatty-acyl-phospholipid synthase
MAEIPQQQESLSNIVDRIAEKGLKLLLAGADIEVGRSPSAEIIVHDDSFYRDVLTTGSLGLGDSYIDGKWDCEKIDELIYKILTLGIHQKLAPVYNIAGEIKRRALNLQSRERAKQVIEEHYDLPSEFYASFLDPYFQYTCARFEGTADLDKAQEIKMGNICKKLGLKAGDKVMDIGGGWGGLAHFMASNCGVEPTVVTLSKTQAEHIKRTRGDEIKVQLCDYRDIPDELNGRFDAVTAVGILEHIGHQNYADFMGAVDRVLKPSGKLLIHTLYTPQSRPVSNAWLHKHIFPNGELAPREMIEENLSSDFEPADGPNGEKSTEEPAFEDITPNYFPTLHTWKDRLTESQKAGKINLSEREFRKWIYYFMSCAGAIKAGHMRVGQFLYGKKAKTPA